MSPASVISCQHFLALLQRHSPQVVAVEIEQIEDVVEHREYPVAMPTRRPPLPNSGALLHQAE